MDYVNSTFPSMTDGDVKIVLSASRIHQASGLSLKTGTIVGELETQQDGLPAGYFVDLLAPEAASQLSDAAVRRGVTTQYHLVATGLTRVNGKFILALTSVPLDSEGRPLNNVRPFLGHETGQRVPVVSLAFTAILASLHGKPIELAAAGGADLEDRVDFAIHVIDLAEQLGVKYYIAQEVARALMQETDEPTFYRAIASRPAYWLEFGKRIRSREIFHEALIHAAGQFKTMQMQESVLYMHPNIRDIVLRRHDELKEHLKTFFVRELSYYPSLLQRYNDGGMNDLDNIGKASYSKDIFHWIALTIFRQWVAKEAVTSGNNEDMGYAIVQKIYLGENSYLNRGDVLAFQQMFPMTTKALDIVEHHLHAIKRHVQEWAIPLLMNKSEVRADGGLLGMFTCTVVKDEDYPFEEVSNY